MALKYMKQLIVGGLRKLIPKKVQNLFRLELEAELNELRQQTVCFSQEGEDLILDTFFSDVTKGYFVDIGAYDPVKYSNTYLFYKRGWRGINIDPRPGSMQAFNTVRPEDRNIEAAVGLSSKKVKYYMFDEPGLNGFSEEISTDRNNNTVYKIVDVIELPQKPLREILDENIPAGTEISFMDIDVEGFDLEVLKSNDWLKYKPAMVLVETSVTGEQDGDGISAFLKNLGYKLVAQTYRTSFYKQI
jgi:FkbM family methyltransferase